MQSFTRWQKAVHYVAIISQNYLKVCLVCTVKLFSDAWSSLDLLNTVVTHATCSQYMSLASLTVLRFLCVFHCLVLYLHACCIIVTW